MGYSACGKVGNAVKIADFFGIPVSLTHDGERKFKTACSGCISLCLGLGLFVGFWISFLNVYGNPQYLATPPTYNFDHASSYLQTALGNTLALKIENDDWGVSPAEARVVFYGLDTDKGEYGPINSVYCSDLYAE